ncbi:unnamed protein product, partial [Effrenium voratum]
AMREESEAVRLNKTVVQGSKEKWIKLLVILIMEKVNNRRRKEWIFRWWCC